MNFRDVWILHFGVSEFEFYPQNFKSVWILLRNNNIFSWSMQSQDHPAFNVELPLKPCQLNKCPKSLIAIHN